MDGTVNSCVTSQKFQVSKCGERVIDYKEKREKVGEWKDSSKLIISPISDMPDQVCFGLEDWLTRIKPKLKEGHDFYIDGGGKPRKVKAVKDDESVREEDLQ